MNKAEIETDSESNNTICFSQLEEEMDIEDNYINNGRYNISTKLEKIDFKAMEACIQNKKNKKIIKENGRR